MNKLNCHDCNCREGELHHFGCDTERCPFCGRQLITCSCCYDYLRINHSEGSYAYSHGLTKKQEKRWLAMLLLQNRIPWLYIPNLCIACGENWPEPFGIPDEEWEKYVIPALQKYILCKSCYEKIKQLFPNGWRRAKEVKEGK